MELFTRCIHLKKWWRHKPIWYYIIHITWKWRNCPVQSQPLLLILHFTRSDSIFLSHATSGKNWKRRNTKEQLLQCVSFGIACTSIDFVFLKSTLHVFHVLNWLFLVQHIMQIILKHYRIQSYLTNMNLGKGGQLSQRRILLLSVLQRFEEKKKQKNDMIWTDSRCTLWRETGRVSVKILFNGNFACWFKTFTHKKTGCFFLTRETENNN